MNITEFIKMKAYEIKLQKKGSGFLSEQIKSAEDAEKFARQFYSDDIGIYESMFMMILNRANKVIGWTKISQGGTCATITDVKIIAKIAIDSLANAIILVHNHPSGNPNPSAEDNRLTAKIKEMLKVFDIQLTDHLIITEDGFYSYSDKGRM